ncbi:hypothetical protein QJS10_CPB17g00531 [Acorus calamus]|uniref:Myb/SANT-like domain-containing protein n=1 Tax=Acorus calamus TaxID=4465 RepID=A0AAV9CWG7_ACOCL|nr:hypothetical protein QJS10_CPB17g00531 [Acorus calamus]
MSKSNGETPRLGSGSKRIANWTPDMDCCLIKLLKEQYQSGNCSRGTFSKKAWNLVVPAFNEQMSMNVDKSHCHNRWKVLKGKYQIYSSLSNRDGWGWDDEKKMAIPSDTKDWAYVIAQNKKYATIRDRPFAFYRDFVEICGKMTLKECNLIGSNSDSAHESSESVGESNDTKKIPMAELQINENGVIRSPPRVHDTLFAEEAVPIFACMVDEGTSSSEPLIGGNEGLPNKKQRLNMTTGLKRKRKSSTDHFVAQLVDIGRQKLEISRAYLEREIASKPTVYSIEECIERLLSYSNISVECTLAATEALKDEKNRIIFMTLKEDMRIPWIERQAIVYSLPHCDPLTPQK